MVGGGRGGQRGVLNVLKSLRISDVLVILLCKKAVLPDVHHFLSAALRLVWYS